MNTSLSSNPTIDLLKRCESNDKAALDEVFHRVYGELRSLARRAHRGGSATLQTTDLIHEAYLKLSNAQSLSVESRRHFCLVAARAMRQILLNAAEARSARKRGGADRPLELIETMVGEAELDYATILTIAESVEALRGHDARMAEVVELRYFAGYTSEECANILNLSIPTVQRDWRMARAWLKGRLADSGEAEIAN